MDIRLPLSKLNTMLQRQRFFDRKSFPSVKDDRLSSLDYQIPTKIKRLEQEVKRLIEAILPGDKVRRKSRKEKIVDNSSIFTLYRDEAKYRFKCIFHGIYRNQMTLWVQQ